MTYYYGAIVRPFERDVEPIEGEFDYKPAHEDAGWFAFAKWFKTEQEQLEFMIYTLKEFKAQLLEKQKAFDAKNAAKRV